MPRSPQKSYSSSKSTVSKPNLPVPYTPAPPPMAYQPAAPSFGQVVKEGFGLGVGQSIAHRAVSAVLGPPSISMTQQQSPSIPETKKNCLSERDTFETCMKTSGREDTCNQELFAYKDCIKLNQK